METETKQVPFNIGRNKAKRAKKAKWQTIRKALVAAIGTNNKAPKLREYGDDWRFLLD